MSNHLNSPTLPRHRILNAVLATMISASAVQAQASRVVRQDGLIEVNGGRLYYEMRGAESTMLATPVILVHGPTLDCRSWDAQFKVLSKFFTTYRYDLRGHGLSDAVTGPVGSQEDLIGLMDALGIEKAHVIGQSLGGNIVTEVAVSHPQRAETLTLIDSGINGFTSPTPNVPLNSQFELCPETYSRLSLIRIPTLVLVGEFDHPEFQTAADILHQQIKGASKVVIPAAGHMSHQEEPQEVTWEILEFLLQRQ